MKSATPVLSPEQRRAQNSYQLAKVPALFIAMAVVVVASTTITISLSRIGLMTGSSGSLVFVPIMFAGFLWAHLRAVRAVRSAGLSLEQQQVEVLERIALHSQGESRGWWQPKRFLAALWNVIFLWLLSATCWGMWHFDSSRFIKGEMMLVFWMLLALSVSATIFIRSPRIRIDNDGVTALNFWPRRVPWNSIARCEIRTIYNFMGQGPTQIFRFKSATGKTLLCLSPLSSTPISNGLSRDEQAEIEREIRRRLGHLETEN